MEIMIVLVIMASVFAFGYNMMGSGVDDNMRKVSGQLVGLIRYVYDQAALKNEYYRITFDLYEQKFFVEYSDLPFYVIRDDDEAEAIRKHNEEKNTIGTDTDSADNTSTAAATGDFGESEDDLLEMFAMPDNVRLSDIYVEHQKDKLSEGKIYLYFFPRGKTEFAVIHMNATEGDDAMTLVVNPLTGKVDVISEYKEYEDIIKEQGIGSPN